jgi:hypothetical protein
LRSHFVVAAHLKVRLTFQFLRALHLELFTKPSKVDLSALETFIEGGLKG